MLFSVWASSQIELLDLRELEVGVVEVRAREGEAVGRAGGQLRLGLDPGQLDAHDAAEAQGKAVVYGDGVGASLGGAAHGDLGQAHGGVGLGEGPVYARLEVLGLVDEAHYLAYEYVPLAVHELIAGLGQGAGTLCGVQVALCGRGLRQALTSLSGAASAVTACARAGRSVRPAPCRKRARARPAGVSKGAPSPGPAWPGCCGPRTCPG